MNQLVVSGPAISDFLTCRGRTELVDDKGNVIGFFEPTLAADASLYARARQLISDAELERRRHEPDELTTAEVWRRIAEVERATLGRPGAAQS